MMTAIIKEYTQAAGISEMLMSLPVHDELVVYTYVYSIYMYTGTFTRLIYTRRSDSRCMYTARRCDTPVMVTPCVVVMASPRREK